MFTLSKPLGLAATLIFISAILHLIAPLLSGFSSQSLMLVPFGIAYAVIAYFLPPNRRWLAWIAFFVVLFFGIAALSGAMGISSVPSWLNWGIFIADWAAAASLLVYLWRNKPVAA